MARVLQAETKKHQQTEQIPRAIERRKTIQIQVRVTPDQQRRLIAAQERYGLRSLPETIKFLMSQQLGQESIKEAFERQTQTFEHLVLGVEAEALREDSKKRRKQRQ